MKTAKGLAAEGFTLVEILISLALIGVLVALSTAGLSKYFESAERLKCLAMMRRIGSAIQAYSADNQNEFPRSAHNSWMLGKQAWGRAIIPYLDESAPENAPESWFYTRYRCPADKRTHATARSYALNVFFQLGAADSYTGSPATWWTTPAVPYPASTVLVAENKSGADHFMSHMWSTPNGASNAVDTVRHVQNANYLFVDGHIESLKLSDTFNPAANINRWNPSLAGNR